MAEEKDAWSTSAAGQGCRAPGFSLGLCSFLNAAKNGLFAGAPQGQYWASTWSSARRCSAKKKTDSSKPGKRLLKYLYSERHGGARA